MNEENKPVKKRLGFVGVDMVKCRIRQLFSSVEIMEKAYVPFVEKIWYTTDYKLPFVRVQIVLRFGLKNEEKPHYSKISKPYNSLPLAIEFDTHELLWADKQGAEALALLFKIGVLKALIDAGKKYKLPVEELEVELVNRQAELMGEEWWRVYLEAE